MRPLPPTASSAQSRSQRSDSLPQLTLAAPLECFLTTESTLQDDRGFHQQPGPAIPRTAHKRHGPETPTPDYSTGLLPQDHVMPSSLNHTVQTRKSQSSPSMYPTVPDPSLPNSVPSSPGTSSTISFSELHASLSASFSELPPSQSPVPSPSTSPASTRVLIPQLVMPSLILPQRRPFTETGRSLGKLKLLVTGKAGIGKTSLISAIAQSCIHIVHLDKTHAASPSLPSTIYASTRPKPWWGAASDYHGRKRRPSSTPDEVLDRNLCFVDCPMIGNQHALASSPAIDYVNSQLFPLCDKSINDRDLRTLLAGGAEANVDAVLYLLPYTGPTEGDMAAMRALQDTTNIIPLIARADCLTSDELAYAKKKIAKDLEAANVDCFPLTLSESAQEFPGIYAVSSAVQSDNDMMDASILMNSNYLPPLVRTDLSHLVSRLLSVDGSAWLRHSAASKAIRWIRHHRQPTLLPLSTITRQHNSLALSTASMHLIHRPSTSHHLRGRIEVASWAEGLRRSLDTERFAQCVSQLDSSAPMSLTRAGCHRSCSEPGHSPMAMLQSRRQDPLGLLEVLSRLRSGGRLTLELLSSFGILGCVVAWIIRPELMHGWNVRISSSIRLV